MKRTEVNEYVEKWKTFNNDVKSSPSPSHIIRFFGYMESIAVRLTETERHRRNQMLEHVAHKWAKNHMPWFLGSEKMHKHKLEHEHELKKRMTKQIIQLKDVLNSNRTNQPSNQMTRDEKVELPVNFFLLYTYLSCCIDCWAL